MIHKIMSVPKTGINEMNDHHREIPTRTLIRQAGINVAIDKPSHGTAAAIISLLCTMYAPPVRR